VPATRSAVEAEARSLCCQVWILAEAVLGKMACQWKALLVLMVVALLHSAGAADEAASPESEIAEMGDMAEGGTVIDIEWLVTDYDPIEAKVGDTLRFTYAPSHTLFQVNAFECNFDGATQLGDLEASPVEVPLKDPGVFYYACDIPGHCPAGQLLSVTVS